jgi:hypothetical protein
MFHFSTIDKLTLNQTIAKLSNPKKTRQHSQKLKNVRNFQNPNM